MARYSTNLVTGRQLRAARVLAGLTQRTLGAALGVDERQIRFLGATAPQQALRGPGTSQALSARCWTMA